MERSEEILRYWFGEESSGWACPPERMELWFGKHPETDAELRRSFADDVARALCGALDDWAETPRGRLALVILLDQMTRNIHRGKPESFSGDEKARALVREGLESGMHRELAPIERAFFYLPLEHSEDLADQRLAVMLFDELEREAPQGSRDPFAVFRDYALRHEAIIERFGRFPHRNALLDRESSPEEIEFLSQPGSSF